MALADNLPAIKDVTSKKEEQPPALNAIEGRMLR
jgi:hypothetical protein